MYEEIPVAAVAAVADNGIIGRDGRLPWRLPKDLRRFRRLTTGHAVLMGRGTWQELERPLPKRFNVIVSTSLAGDRVKTGDRLRLTDRLDSAMALAAAWERQQVSEGAIAAAEIFIIGGAGLWRSAWQLVDRLYLTRVHAEVQGDTHFPEGLLAGFEVSESEPVADACPCTWELLHRRG